MIEQGWPIEKTSVRDHVMREVFTILLPIGAVIFLFVYFFIYNPDQLLDFTHWVERFF